MKTRFLILFAFAGLSSSVPHAFASESFYGTSSFENTPSEISRHFPSTFDIKLQYTVGPWGLDNVVPVIEISPQNAASHVNFDFESISVYKNSIGRIPVTITVDPAIEYEKIFLSVSFEGQNSQAGLLKSGWTDSLILSLGPRDEISRQVDYEKIPWGEIEIKSRAAIFTKNMVPRSMVQAGEQFFVIQKVDFSNDNFAKNSTFDAVVGYAFEKGNKMMHPPMQNATYADHQKHDLDTRKQRNEFHQNSEFAKSFEFKVNPEKPFLVKSSFSLPDSGLYTHQFYKKLKNSPAVIESSMGGTVVVEKFSKAIGENNICKNDNLRILIKHDYSKVVCVSGQTAWKLIERGWGL